MPSLANPDETSAQLARPLADEPRARPYPYLATLRGHIERSRHLSISRLFLGRAGVRNLGLPEHTLPWYPLVNLPFSLGRHLWSRVTPGGMERAARAGRLAQERFLEELTGAEAAVVGRAAQALVA